METEELFLTFACLLLFFDLTQTLRSQPKDKKRLEYGFYALVIAIALIATAYFMFLQAFLKDDFALKEVYLYSSTGLPILSKIYATWAGMSGSTLFSTFLLAIVSFAYRFKTSESSNTFRLTVYKILSFILLFFLIVTLMNSPFERFQGSPMDGKGLNPLLQTFWMAIHPPIVFVGYMFVTLAFALTLAKMKTGDEEDHRMLKLSLQASWLLLTLGIAIGAVWAYEVLGWGGYWAWDPVETASLLPWIALTAYFHLGPLSKKGRSMAGELMILLTFSTVIFTTALTRGGLLVSVHAFGASPVGPVLLSLILGMASYFLYLWRRSRKPLFTMDVEPKSLYSLSIFTSYWSLIFIFLVSFWGVAFPIVAGVFLPNPFTIGPEFYTTWIFPFAMTFVTALIGCSIYDQIKLKGFLLLLAVTLTVGGVLVIGELPTPNSLANLGIPLLVVGLVATAYKLLKSLTRHRKTFRQFGRSLLHLAIIMTLMGVFFSSASKQVSGEVLTQPESTVQTLGLKIAIKNFTIIKGTGNVHSLEWQTCVPEYAALKLDITIEQGSQVIETALWIRRYTLYGIVSPTLIISSWDGDLYIRLLHTESIANSLQEALMNREIYPQDLIVTVEKSPLIYLIWGGVTLMTIGIIGSVVTGLSDYRRTTTSPKEKAVELQQHRVEDVASPSEKMDSK